MSKQSRPGSTAMADQELPLHPSSGGVAESKPSWVDTVQKDEDAMRYFGKHLSISTYRKSSECERDNRGRIKIFIMRSAFVPKQQVVYRIRRAIQTGHSGPFVTWDEFSNNRKLRLFEQLKWHFCWDKKYDEKIYSLWEATASGYLHEVLSNARISGVKPSWIYDRNWSIMLKKWEKNDSEINKRNILKRSSSMEEEEVLRNAKSLKKNEELSSREKDPHTAAPEADTEASSHGENELAPCIVHEVVQEMISKEKDEVKNGGKTIQEQMNELSERMGHQEQLNEKMLEIMLQFEKRVQKQQDLMQIMFAKQNCNGADGGGK